MTGQKWSDGVVSSMVSGAVYNMVTVATGGNTALASYSAAFAESFTSEAGKYLTGKKERTTQALGQSLKTVVKETATKGTLYLATGKIAEKLAPVNYKSWFKPKRVSSCFRGNYARKMQGQTLIQASLIIIGDRL